MVVPPLANLLAEAAPRKLRRDERPLLRPVLLHMVRNLRILLSGEGLLLPALARCRCFSASLRRSSFGLSGLRCPPFFLPPPFLCFFDGG